MYGHLARNCPLPGKVQVKHDTLRHTGLVVSTHVDFNDQNISDYVQNDLSRERIGDKAIYGMCRIDSKETCFLADTGCPRTVINIRVIPEKNRNLIVPVNFYVFVVKIWSLF